MMKIRLICATGLWASVLFIANAMAFDRSIWREETRSTGTTFFFCQSQACGTGAIDSYHPQPASAFPTLESFKAHNDASSVQKLTMLGVKVQMTGADNLSKLGTKDYRLSEIDVDKAGKASHYITGFFALGGQAYTLVASSSSKSQTERNYKLLLDHVRGLIRSI